MPAYKLQGRTKFQGLDISIENKKGSVRRWYDPHGKEKGSTKMHFAYGYIRNTKGTDGDHVDVYIGPNLEADTAFIVNQMKKPPGEIKKDGKAWTAFDEQKVMLGFDSADDAKKAYLKQYDDPRFFGSMKAMPMAEFKEKVLMKENHGKKVAQAKTAVSEKWIAQRVLGGAKTRGFSPADAGRRAVKVVKDLRSEVQHHLKQDPPATAVEKADIRRFGRVEGLRKSLTFKDTKRGIPKGGAPMLEMPSKAKDPFFEAATGELKGGHRRIKYDLGTGVGTMPKQSSGDMLQYFIDNPEKLKEKQERDARKKTSEFLDKPDDPLHTPPGYRRGKKKVAMWTQAAAEKVALSKSDAANILLAGGAAGVGTGALLALAMGKGGRRQVNRELHDPRLYSNLRGMATLESREDRVKAHKNLGSLKGHSVLSAAKTGLTRKAAAEMTDRQHSLAERIDDVGIGLLAAPYAAKAIGGLRSRKGMLGAVGRGADAAGRVMHRYETPMELAGLAMVAPGVTNTLARTLAPRKRAPEGVKTATGAGLGLAAAGSGGKSPGAAPETPKAPTMAAQQRPALVQPQSPPTPVPVPAKVAQVMKPDWKLPHKPKTIAQMSKKPFSRMAAKVSELAQECGLEAYQVEAAEVAGQELAKAAGLFSSIGKGVKTMFQGGGTRNLAKATAPAAAKAKPLISKKTMAGAGALGLVGAGVYGGKKVIDKGSQLATERHGPTVVRRPRPGMPAMGRSVGY